MADIISNTTITPILSSDYVTDTIINTPFNDISNMITDIQSHHNGTLRHDGDLTVTGTLSAIGGSTFLYTQVVQSKDNNIELNKNGTNATAENGGITILGTSDVNLATIKYDSTLPTKFKLGINGAEKQVVDIDTIQTLSNKTITAIPSGEAATPSLAFGDGDTGFFESSDDLIQISINGDSKFYFEYGNFAGISANGPLLVNIDSSATTTNISPSRADGDTGLGRASEDQLSLIAGSKEIARASENVTEQLIINPQGDLTGTLAAPSLAFGDGDTGFYEFKDDRLDLAVNGSKFGSFGADNLFLGYLAGQADISGIHNVGLGFGSLTASTSGQFNTACGVNSLYGNTIGNVNVAVGYNALAGNVDGGYNVAIGVNSLYSQVSVNYNVGIGYEAGFSNVSGSGNVFLGFRAGYNETGSNKLYIDNSNTSEPLIYGDFNTDELKINGSLDIKGGGGVNSATVGGTLTVNTSAYSTPADTAEHDAITYNLPANTLNNDGKIIKVTAFGENAANANGKSVRIYFGSTVVSSYLGFGNVPNWEFTAYIIRTGSGTQLGKGTNNIGNSVTITTPSETETGDINIRLTLQNGTAQASDITARGMIVELLN